MLSTADECLRRAEDAERDARQLGRCDHRELLLEIAAEWRKMAEQLREREKGSAGERPDQGE